MNREHRKLVKVRSNRLQDYDYAKPGAYFITICTLDRVCMFGKVVSDKMRLNFLGEVVKEELFRSFEIRKELLLDEWIIMPNHVHLIVFLNDLYYGMDTNEKDRRFEARKKPYRSPKSISTFVSGFKGAVSRRLNKIKCVDATSVWQTNYNDRIIGCDYELEIKRNYIIENPIRWCQDELYSEK